MPASRDGDEPGRSAPDGAVDAEHVGSRAEAGEAELLALRGNVLVENDELVASPGVGQFVARARFGERLAG